MVIYLSVKGSFILVETCIGTIIITCDTFKNMIANSVGLMQKLKFLLKDPADDQ